MDHHLRNLGHNWPKGKQISPVPHDSGPVIKPDVRVELVAYFHAYLAWHALDPFPKPSKTYSFAVTGQPSTPKDEKRIPTIDRN
jgi:hypothetical protein